MKKIDPKIMILITVIIIVVVAGIIFNYSDSISNYGSNSEQTDSTQSIIESSTESESMVEETIDSIREQNSDVKIEWLTWSFFRITTPDGKVILTNPRYTNPDSSITLDDIPEADIILVPTGHPDEVGNALEVAAKTNATIVASHELINLVWKDEHE
ncbi:MAG: hypothetical protein V3T40_06995, partial [Nitrososphaerales archaeon]